MARCPNCDCVLSDEWIKSEGASLMGKTAKGRRKRRTKELAQAAAEKRWKKRRKLNT